MVEENFKIQDIDGNIYNPIKIGKQIWTTKNLDVSHYRNGDIIPQIQDNKEWVNLKTGAWCYYENDLEKGKIYGKLYNWYAINDPRGLAPEGWNIASDFDWSRLSIFLGGEKIANDKLKSTSGWKDNYNGIDEFKFNALPAGGRKYDGGFSSLHEYACFWTSSNYDDKNSWYRHIRFDDKSLFRSNGTIISGYSCRCIKN